MPHHIEESVADGVIRIKVEGEIDLYSSPELREAVNRAIEKVDSAVVVDLSDVAYMDSSGVATLVEALRQAGKRNVELVLLSPSQQVLKVLQLARLDTLFDIRDSV